MMGIPVFSCELHARVTLATDLQAMKDDVLAAITAARLAHVYRLSFEVADHIRDKELEWRRR